MEERNAEQRQREENEINGYSEQKYGFDHSGLMLENPGQRQCSASTVARTHKSSLTGAGLTKVRHAPAATKFRTAAHSLIRSRRFADVCVTSAYPARAAAKRTLWHFAFVPSEPVSKALRCR
jgi:hypothetical protein